MAGARVEITKDTASPALKRAILKLQGEGRALMLEGMGNALKNSTRERAARQIDPDGNKWRALTPAYARWKQKKKPGAPMLKFDEHMLGDRLSHQVDGADLLVGTSAVYGARHQFGGTSTHPASRRKLTFGKNKSNGMKVFARAGSKNADHEKWATVKQYTVTLPARPWLGVSQDDEKALLDIAADHLGDAFEGN